MKPILVIIGISMMVGGFFYLGPLLGVSIPIVLPLIGPMIMGFPAIGMGLFLLGLILTIAGIKIGY